MGKRDFEKREAKKPKKDAKNPPVISTLEQPPAEVEVVRKRRKSEEEPEE